MSTRRKRGRLCATISAFLALAALQARAEEQRRTFEIYGFAEADYIQDSKRSD